MTDPPVDEGPKYCFKCSASIGLDFIREEGLPCFTPDDETKTIESKGCCFTRYGVVEGHPDQLQYVQRGTDDCSDLEAVCEDMPLNEIDDVSYHMNPTTTEPYYSLSLIGKFLARVVITRKFSSKYIKLLLKYN